MDQLLASKGLLHGAQPVFAPERSIPGAGVLLAVPLLVQSQLLETFGEQYLELVTRAAFYGLRTTVMTLLFMGLLTKQKG